MLRVFLWLDDKLRTAHVTFLKISGDAVLVYCHKWECERRLYAKSWRIMEEM